MLGAEGWPESVNFRERAGERFTFQLPAHGEVGRTRKKILRIIHRAVCSPGRIRRINRRNAEQFAGAFAIAARDDWGVDVNERAFLEKLMNRESQPAPDAKDGAKQVRARPQMRNFAQELRRVPLLLERIRFVGLSDDFDLTRNFGVRAEYRGLVYKVPDFSLNNLNLDKVTHLAQPSIGFFVRF